MRTDLMSALMLTEDEMSAIESKIEASDKKNWVIFLSKVKIINFLSLCKNIKPVFLIYPDPLSLARFIYTLNLAIHSAKNKDFHPTIDFIFLQILTCMDTSSENVKHFIDYGTLVTESIDSLYFKDPNTNDLIKFNNFCEMLSTIESKIPTSTNIWSWLTENHLYFSKDVLDKILAPKNAEGLGFAPKKSKGSSSYCSDEMGEEYREHAAPKPEEVEKTLEDFHNHISSSSLAKPKKSLLQPFKNFFKFQQSS